jgi:hypothetical protein
MEGCARWCSHVLVPFLLGLNESGHPGSEVNFRYLFFELREPPVKVDDAFFKNVVQSPHDAAVEFLSLLSTASSGKQDPRGSFHEGFDVVSPAGNDATAAPSPSKKLRPRYNGDRFDVQGFLPAHGVHSKCNKIHVPPVFT